MKPPQTKKTPRTDRNEPRIGGPLILSKLVRFVVDDRKMEALATEILRLLGLTACELCISFVSPRRIRSMNQSFRGIDKVTDVLSFPQLTWSKAHVVGASKKVNVRQDGPPVHLGDIVIAPSQALTNAKAIGQSLDREVCFLLIHGILHLCGHDHKKPREEKIMIAEQKKILAHLATAGRRAPWRGCVKSRDDLAKL